MVNRKHLIFILVMYMFALLRMNLDSAGHFLIRVGKLFLSDVFM